MSYLPIRLKTIRCDDPVTFDLYIQLGDRHLHYIRNSDSFDKERLQNLQKKGVKKMYILETEEDFYLQYLESGLGKLKDNSMSTQAKGEMVHDSLITESENAERALESEEAFKKTEGRITKIIGFLTGEKGALKSVLGQTGHAIDDFQHAANVASMSLSLAGKIGGFSEQEMLELGLASLLHDLGKKKLPKIEGMHRSKIPKELKPEYRKHSQYSVEMLQGKPFVTPKILGLIIDHEEFGEGQGFPEKKWINKLPPISQILNLCNDFDQFSTEVEKSPVDAMKMYFDQRASYFDLDHVMKLGEILQEPPA